ncbi:MAG: polysaccharide deacetylase family protein [Asgard group archaeon]|nr:polysaccharide deacetylase family protein [Asgard group archaeon]
MPKKVTVILHWNTDYAEIPRKELSNVVNMSYNPMVTAIEEWHSGKVLFNITGHTFQYLEQHYPELLDRIATLVKDGIIELTGTGFSHPILPLLPKERVKKQISDHLKYIEKRFNKRPKGFWPPELAVSPFVCNEIKAQGIDWIVIDYEHFELCQWFGNDLNAFERREKTITEILIDAFWAKGLQKIITYLRAMKTLRQANRKYINPLKRITIGENTSLKAYLSAVSWTYSTQFAVGGQIPLYGIRQHMKEIMKVESKILPLYGSDIEFFGYRELGPTPAKPRVFIQFLEQLEKKGITTISPSELPQESWASQADFLSTGSWSPDKSLRIWTESEDNKEFLRRSREIYGRLKALNWDNTILTQIEPELRILENSDSRGWAPLPERKQEAYSAMLKIYEILE